MKGTALTVVAVLACVAPGASTFASGAKSAIKARDLMRASMDGLEALAKDASAKADAVGSGDSPHRRLANCAASAQIKLVLDACLATYTNTVKSADASSNVAGKCGALVVFQNCMCSAGDQCGDDAGRAEVVNQLKSATSTICDDGNQVTNYKQSGPDCINAINTVCVSDQCPKGGFGDISARCATALAEQFSQKTSSLPTGLVGALQALQGVTKQTHLVEQDSVKIPNGYWVPNCAKPTDVFLCRQKEPAADPTAGGGVPTPAPSSGDFANYDNCGVEDAAANTGGGSYTKQVDKAGKCINNDGSKLDPLDTTSGCCDRPLRPGICVPGQSISTDTVVSHKCEKRWMFDRIRDFRLACNAAVGASATKYGDAFFLSAKSRLQINKVAHEQTIIDANVLCWPTACKSSDLHNHLASRAKECTKNFMSTCSYSARPIECNQPEASSAACTASATVGVTQWNKPTDPARQWGYTLCDNIMDGENGLKGCVYTVGSLAPVVMTVSFAGMLRPAMLTVLLAIFSTSLLLINGDAFA